MDLGLYFRTLNTVKERYPQAWNWLAQHPDLLNIYVSSVTDNWPPERLQAALSNTDYYKTTSDKMRAWDVLTASNPGEAQNLIQRAATKVTDYAKQMGLGLSQEQIYGFGSMTSRWGSTDEEIHDFLVGVAAKTPEAGRNPGQFGATMTKVRKVADEYAVPITDAFALEWATNLLTSQSRGGRQTEDSLRDTLTKQATSLYPQFAEELATGRTIADWAEPYKAVAARELAIDPSQITFNDPKWQKMLQGVRPDANSPIGIASRPLTVAEWQSKVRTDEQYGYDKTVGGRTAAAGIAQEIAKMFGNAA